MSRAIVYPRGFALTEGAKEPPDNYREQVAKYVPAEALAFWVAVLALMDPTKNGELYWIVVAAGLIGTGLYQLRNGLGLPGDQRPYPHFYVLAAISFPVWAVFGFEEAQQWWTGVKTPDMVAPTVAFLAWFFLVPAIDWGLQRLGKALGIYKE
ncbi:MAG TPA: hypothetical protein VES62_07345 [Thermoleophilaceae bacterium]|nr:hypothetical protein [Thermoleophilaceae bacterium]